MVESFKEVITEIEWDAMVFPSHSVPTEFSAENACVHIDAYGRSRLQEREHPMGDPDEMTVNLQHVGTGILVTLTGSLNEITAPVVGELLSWPDGTRPAKFYLDLSGIWEIDTIGLALIEDLADAHAMVPAHVIRTSEAMERLAELVA